MVSGVDEDVDLVDRESNHASRGEGRYNGEGRRNNVNSLDSLAGAATGRCTGRSWGTRALCIAVLLAGPRLSLAFRKHAFDF